MYTSIMATTIKVEDKTKTDLENLRAEILLNSNIKLTIEKLQDCLTSLALENKESSLTTWRRGSLKGKL
ncbi:hypothetical protein MetMK1DRAFT_00008170 [Metallosphaera yellowstonensis MK1]|jgi:hypothetical protein|uniref:Uncharacterized protein n=1 Tax=Metallosphaera yellowstonensis MK1 TaxID=671065 RepID=H2C244_9CREN|nr:hypothetical protein MetMK1DRAFT_00008170 [Metallosphaera yellowstonensis MK1]